MNKKEIRKFERIFKGLSNHRRIEILLYLKKNDGASLDTIAKTLKCNFKTIFEHTRKLKIAGLINKYNSGNLVEHTLTPYGKKILKIIETF